MTYDETIAYLYAATPAFHQVGAAAYKPGLENTYRLMEHLGNPHEQFRSIHIAGTNGKGSTSHMIAAALQASGMRVGLYTSPHLVDYRERIKSPLPTSPYYRGGMEMITKEYVVDWVERNRDFLEANRPSFFEMATAMAFSYFRDTKVDIAVIEVGLGGRLDCTNIIHPILSVITNIGMDHTEFLGNTLEAIASEKAGIIKPGVPIIIGETQAETELVFRRKAAECGSEIEFADQENTPEMECELHGAYQQKNIRTAYTALKRLAISDEAIREGFAKVCTMTGLRGRWEVLRERPLTICDTGHNSHGIRTYVEQLRALSTGDRHLRMVFGMVNDKDVDTVMQLLPKEAFYYWTEADTHRAIPSAEMRMLGLQNGLIGDDCGSVQQALRKVMTEAEEDDIIFIGGSNYVVGEAISVSALL